MKKYKVLKEGKFVNCSFSEVSDAMAAYVSAGYMVRSSVCEEFEHFMAIVDGERILIAYGEEEDEETLSDDCETEMCDCCARADWCLRT